MSATSIMNMVTRRVESGPFGNTSEDVCELIRRDQREQDIARLRALVEAGLANGPAKADTADDGAELEAVASKLVKAMATAASLHPPCHRDAPRRARSPIPRHRGGISTLGEFLSCGRPWHLDSPRVGLNGRAQNRVLSAKGGDLSFRFDSGEQAEPLEGA